MPSKGRGGARASDDGGARVTHAALVAGIRYPLLCYLTARQTPLPHHHGGVSLAWPFLLPAIFHCARDKRCARVASCGLGVELALHICLHAPAAPPASDNLQYHLPRTTCTGNRAQTRKHMTLLSSSSSSDRPQACTTTCGATSCLCHHMHLRHHRHHHRAQRQWRCGATASNACPPAAPPRSIAACPSALRLTSPPSIPAVPPAPAWGRRSRRRPCVPFRAAGSNMSELARGPPLQLHHWESP